MMTTLSVLQSYLTPVHQSLRSVFSDTSRNRPFSSRRIRCQFFEQLEDRLVLNSAPTFVDLPESIVIVAGSAYHLALNATDSDGDALSFTVQSGAEGQLGGGIVGGQSVKMTISYTPDSGTKVYGEIIFKLFEQDAPLATARIKQLISDGFYNDVIFHRIVDNFMMQGGDPTGTGSGGSNYGKFADEFSSGLKFTGKGLVAMANSGANTNDSQFFITDAATAHLDGKHTIFGFVTKGDAVRDAITKVSVDSNSKPVKPVTIESISLINDTSNGVVRLLAKDTYSGETTMTVTVSDGKGGTVSKDVKVTVVPSSSDSTPWNLPTKVEVSAGGSHQFTFPEFSFPAAVTYTVTKYSQSQAGMTVSHSGRNVTIVADNTTYGIQYISVTATSLDGWYSITRWIQVHVSPAAPTVSLSTQSDTGTVGDAITQANNSSAAVRLVIDNVVSGGKLNPDVSKGEVGVKLDLFMDGIAIPYTVIGTPTIGTNGFAQVVVETIANVAKPWTDGQHRFNVRQTIVLQSDVGAPLVGAMSAASTMIVDTVVPVFEDGAEGYYDAVIGQLLEINCRATDSNNSSVAYSLGTQSVPNGMTINSTTGLVTWTPQDNQLGEYDLEITATDGAGNKAIRKIHISFQAGADFNIAGTRDINEGESFILHLSPMDLEEGVTVTYSVYSTTIPAGSQYSISATENNEAVFTWTTKKWDGPQTYTVTFRQTDSEGNARLKTVTLTVRMVNEKPTIFFDDAFYPDYTVDEHVLLSATAKVTDPDLHPGGPEKIYFSLRGDVPRGMTIHSDTGVISWIPGEECGGESYTVTVRVTDCGGVFDGLSNGLFDETDITITVRETDSPPVFDEVSPQQAKTGTTYTLPVRAQDPDYRLIPADETGATLALKRDVFNEIRYSLGPNAPDGMVIHPLTGDISWFIPVNFIQRDVLHQDIEFTVIATETNSSPDMADYEFQSTSQLFTVRITNTQREMELTLAAQSVSQSGYGFAQFSALNSVFPEYHLFHDHSRGGNGAGTLGGWSFAEMSTFVASLLTGSPFRTVIGDEVSYGDSISRDVPTDGNSEENSQDGDNDLETNPQNQQRDRNRSRLPRLPSLTRHSEPSEHDAALLAFCESTGTAMWS